MPQCRESNRVVMPQYALSNQVQTLLPHLKKWIYVNIIRTTLDPPCSMRVNEVAMPQYKLSSRKSIINEKAMHQYKLFEVDMPQYRLSSQKTIINEKVMPQCKLSHNSSSIMLRVIFNQSQMLPMCELSITMLKSQPQDGLKTWDITQAKLIR